MDLCSKNSIEIKNVFDEVRIDTENNKPIFSQS